MRTITTRFSAKIGLGIVILFAFPLVGMASNDLAVISGQVRDSSGTPVVGALVIAVAASPVIPERIAFTDKRGSFTLMNLFAGEYSVKVTMPKFLPAMKQGIRLNSGGSAILTVNLQNALDVVRRAVSRDKAQSDDIVWTLRSSRATQPVLRLAEEASNKAEAPASLSSGRRLLRIFPGLLEIGGNLLWHHRRRRRLPVFCDNAPGREVAGYFRGTVQRSSHTASWIRCHIRVCAGRPS